MSGCGYRCMSVGVVGSRGGRWFESSMSSSCSLLTESLSTGTMSGRREGCENGNDVVALCVDECAKQ